MNTKKILLVEDDLLLKELYTDLLKQNGLSVTDIEDGQKAYELINTEQWDLVLLDLNLPGMNGFEILKNTGKQTLTKNIKKLIILSNRDEDTQTEEIKDVVDGYLIKSKMSPDDFVKRIKAQLE